MQYKILHKNKPNYGKTSIELYDVVKSIIVNKKIKTVLDFGCGKSELIDRIHNDLGILCYRYDPAIEEYSRLIEHSVDLILCTDVLQHIPEYDLDSVFLQMRRLSNCVFFKIKCTQHHTLLPNGEFANCTVHDVNWWEKFIKKYYDSIEIINYADLTSVIFLVKECKNEL